VLTRGGSRGRSAFPGGVVIGLRRQKEPMSIANPNPIDRSDFGRSAGFTLASCRPDARCQNGNGERVPLTCAVRYGALAYVGEFRYSPGAFARCGVKVVVQTNRGIEIGQVLGLTCTGCEKSIPRERMVEYARISGNDFFQPKAGRILREATPQDLLEAARLNEDSDAKLSFAQELARADRLDMKFVLCEHLLGGERIIFHFMAENRVDFRNLVRELAHEYHTRIEMHQIGSRDEARLVADYEICGRECCCRNYLKKLRPVTMRMAKLQKATLDPSKVSGRCGRLRCCLRYEHEGYEELSAKLPKTGTRVRTERGIGTIKDRQILTQLLLVEYDEGGTVEAVAVDALLETGLPKRPPPPPAQTEDRSEAGSREGRRDQPARDRGDRPDRRPTPAAPKPRMAAEQETSRDAADAGATDIRPDGGAAAAADEPVLLQSTGENPAAATGEPRSRRRRRRGGRGRRSGRAEGSRTTEERPPAKESPPPSGDSSGRQTDSGAD